LSGLLLPVLLLIRILRLLSGGLAALLLPALLILAVLLLLVRFIIAARAADAGRRSATPESEEVSPPWLSIFHSRPDLIHAAR
jgi:hypothetical protein